LAIGIELKKKEKTFVFSFFLLIANSQKPIT
jgi:hypothetical protein